MIYLTNLIKWCTLHSQMEIIINPNSQQYAEMEIEMLQILPKQNTDFVHFLLYQYFKLAFELSFIALQKK